MDKEQLKQKMYEKFPFYKEQIDKNPNAKAEIDLMFDFMIESVKRDLHTEKHTKQ